MRLMPIAIACVVALFIAGFIALGAADVKISGVPVEHPVNVADTAP